MTDQAMSPLRRRMIEDMTIRKFAPKTQHDYLQRVKNFAAYLGRSPDTASSEDVRRYPYHQPDDLDAAVLLQDHARSRRPRGTRDIRPWMVMALFAAHRILQSADRVLQLALRFVGAALGFQLLVPEDLPGGLFHATLGLLS